MKWWERKQLVVVRRRGWDERERKMQRMMNVVKLHDLLRCRNFKIMRSGLSFSQWKHFAAGSHFSNSSFKMD